MSCKNTQKKIKYKSLLKNCAVILLAFFISTADAKNNNNFDLAQTIRSIALIYTDDKLDPEVEKFLNHKQETIWEDNAYVYFWGINIKSKTPYKAGKEILEGLMKDSYHGFEHIELIKHKFLCEIESIECLESIIKNNAQVKKFVIQNKELIERYQTFLKFKHLDKIHYTGLIVPVHNINTLRKIQDLYHLKLLSDFLHNDPNVLIKKLVNELNDLKFKLIQANDLYIKFAINRLINKNINLFNILYQKTELDFSSVDIETVFSSLSIKEMSFESTYNSDFQNMLKLVYQETSDPGFYNQRLKKTKINEKMFFLISKPNLTVNTQYYTFIKPILDQSRLNPTKFENSNDEFNIKARHDWIRNYFGSELSNIIFNSYRKYITFQSTIYELNKKIELLRLLIQYKSVSDLIKNTKSASLFDKSKPYQKDKKLCYSGLIERNEKYRCLIIY
jgi:hypothetical protein